MPVAVELTDVSFGYRPGQRVLEDELFRDLIQCSRELHKGLLQLFFEDDPLLATLTRKYGIF